MSTDRDTTRVVRSWLEEGVTALPDRVLDAVLDQLPATPQHRLLGRLRRSFQMNSPVRFAIAAAAVLAVALVGYQLLPSNTGDPGGRPSALPSPTTSPTTSLTVPSMPAGEVEPGRYAIAWSGGRLTLEVPRGWSGEEGGISQNPDSDTEIGFGLNPIGPGEAVTHVYTDACHSEGNLEPIGPTADDLVAALEAQLNIDGVVSDVTVGGVDAKRVDLAEPPGLDRATCRYGSVDNPLQIWADAREDSWFALAPGARGIVWALDAGGERLVLVSAYGPAVSEAVLAELDAIVDSITLE
jgi:hypothetical protein